MRSSLPQPSGFLRQPLLRTGGFSMLEVIASMVITVIVASAVIATLLNSQTFAARTRLMTNARLIVQRNVETALGIAFTSVSQPDMLKKTENANGEIFRENGGQSDTMTVAITGDGDTVVEGTLRRIVTELRDDEKPADARTAAIRRVVFRIDYQYLGRDYSYELSTIRAQDDQTM